MKISKVLAFSLILLTVPTIVMAQTCGVKVKSINNNATVINYYKTSGCSDIFLAMNSPYDKLSWWLGDTKEKMQQTSYPKFSFDVSIENQGNKSLTCKVTPQIPDLGTQLSTGSFPYRTTKSITVEKQQTKALSFTVNSIYIEDYHNDFGYITVDCN